MLECIFFFCYIPAVVVCFCVPTLVGIAQKSHVEPHSESPVSVVTGQQERAGPKMSYTRPLFKGRTRSTLAFECERLSAATALSSGRRLELFIVRWAAM